tara:strand:+ start:81 stop:218 length:138 start_codon:yes stop_codon:yes gene_type:complete
MNELKTYSLTGFALIVSSTNIIPALQIISLLLACVYTIIQIKNKL